MTPMWGGKHEVDDELNFFLIHEKQKIYAQGFDTAPYNIINQEHEIYITSKEPHIYVPT